VVIDTPPTSVVSDAIPLVKEVSGVIVVCRLGKTTRESANHLRQQLENLEANTLGVVVNSVGRQSGYGYAYAYGYGYGYGTGAEQQPKRKRGGGAPDVPPVPPGAEQPQGGSPAATAVADPEPAPSTNGAGHAPQAGSTPAAGGPQPPPRGLLGRRSKRRR
jgi:Mrp family chromosome partitioning ATPase